MIVDELNKLNNQFWLLKHVGALQVQKIII